MSLADRRIVLAAAFLGWLFSGVHMTIGTLVSRSATCELTFEGRTKLTSQEEGVVGKWFARHNTAFLLGAAMGGILFGWMGDRFGRRWALGASILCYSGFSALTIPVTSQEWYVALRFITCLGIGGMWPNGVALVAEAWPNVSRPALAGILGSSANLGQVLFQLLTLVIPVTASQWRWTLIVGAVPILLSLFVFLRVPESPRWLAERDRNTDQAPSRSSLATVFQPPILWTTLLGIALGTIPLLGGWGSGNWVVAWADQVGGTADPRKKALAGILRSLGGTFGSFLGGWVGNAVGRRLSYSLVSAGSMAISACLFRGTDPTQFLFMPLTFGLGLISGIFFGWLPLYLPALFETRVRSTGAGISFNLGRIGSAAGVLYAGTLVAYYDGDYGQASAAVSLIYGAGIILPWFMRNAEKNQNH